MKLLWRLVDLRWSSYAVTLAVFIFPKSMPFRYLFRNVVWYSTSPNIAYSSHCLNLNQWVIAHLAQRYSGNSHTSTYMLRDFECAGRLWIQCCWPRRSTHARLETDTRENCRKTMRNGLRVMLECRVGSQWTETAGTDGALGPPTSESLFIRLWYSTSLHAMTIDI